MEKETFQQSGNSERQNCCVVFTDASGDVERSLAAQSHNCCVKFTSKKDRSADLAMKKGLFILLILVVVGAMVVGIKAVGNRGCGKGCEVGFENN